MKSFLAPILGLGLAACLFAAGCGEKPLAKLNGAPITQAEFYQGLQAGVGLQEGFGAGRMVLDTLIVQRLLEREAQKKGVAVSEAEMKDALKKFKDNLQALSGQPMEDFLRQTGATEEDLTKQLKSNLLLRKLAITQQDAEEYFRVHSQEFDKPEQVSFYQMFLPSKEAALAARKEATGGKADFAQVARQRSLPQGPGGLPLPPGGSLSIAEKGKVSDPDPKMEALLFSLKPGQISDPLFLSVQLPANAVSGGGKVTLWRLVQVVSHRAPQKATLENSREEVIAGVYRAKDQSGEVQQYVSKLKAEARLEIIDPRYRPLGEEYKALAKEMPAAKPPLPDQMPKGAPAVPPAPTTP